MYCSEKPKKIVVAAAKTNGKGNKLNYTNPNPNPNLKENSKWGH